MKNIILIAFLFSAICCSKKSLYVLEKNQPIVDLPTNPEFYSAKKYLNAALEKQDKQTVYLLNKKIIKKEQIPELVEKKAFKNIFVIKDSSEIEDLGYPYKVVKQVYILN